MSDLVDLRITCKSQLSPLFEMLLFKKLTLRGVEWVSFVNRTQQNVINSPRQFLLIDAKHDDIKLVISQAFEEFLNECEQTT